MTIDDVIVTAVERAVAPVLEVLHEQTRQLGALRAELAELRAGIDAATTTEPERIYASPSQLAERFSVSVRTIRGLVASGELPTLHVGRRIRINVRDAERVFATRPTSTAKRAARRVGT